MSFWPGVRNKDDNSTIDLPSRLLEDRVILLTTAIDDNVASSIIAQLLYLDSVNHNTIKIYINSPGGQVTSGLAIFDVINNIKSPVATICMGMAASMGAFLLCAGTNGQRYAMPNAEIMIHQPLGGCSGQATDMEIQTMHILEIRKKLYDIMSKSSNTSYEEMAKACERDNYLTPEQAKEMGLIDKILEVTPKSYKKEEGVTNE